MIFKLIDIAFYLPMLLKKTINAILQPTNAVTTYCLTTIGFILEALTGSRGA